MKIFGVTYGFIGDLVIGLPILKCLEKKYPGSFKTFGIQKRFAFSAPLFLNQPLIDRVQILNDYTGFPTDKDATLKEYNIILRDPQEFQNRYYNNWWNQGLSTLEVTAINHGFDVREYLTSEERKPRLDRWFDVGFSPNDNVYVKGYKPKETTYSHIVLFPFTASHKHLQYLHSPSIEWWQKLVKELVGYGHTVYQLGLFRDGTIMDNFDTFSCLSHLDFMKQIQIALSSKLVIGTDNGIMWVMGAYNHPVIHLMTNWLPNHNRNLMCLEPYNDNGETIFEFGGCDNIKIQDVVDNVARRCI